MRIGYSQWGFLSDIEKDTPGGGNFYIPDLVLEMRKRKHEVIMLQPDRDKKRLPKFMRLFVHYIPRRITKSKIANFMDFNSHPITK